MGQRRRRRRNGWLESCSIYLSVAVGGVFCGLFHFTRPTNERMTAVEANWGFEEISPVSRFSTSLDIVGTKFEWSWIFVVIHWTVEFDVITEKEVKESCFYQRF